MLYAALSKRRPVNCLLLLRVLPWKRGANEALGAGWGLQCGFWAPAPCALFAAPANLQGVATPVRIEVLL